MSNVLLKGHRRRTLFFNQHVPIFCQSYTDGPDDAIRLIKIDLNLLIRLLKIDQAVFLTFCF